MNTPLRRIDAARRRTRRPQHGATPQRERTDRLNHTIAELDRVPRETGTWAAVDSDVWVGQIDGAYAGMIERSGELYAASGGTGERVGRFETLAEAVDALSA